MAISGLVDMVYKVDGGIKLDLTAYKDDPCGQRYLTIIEPTWVPPIGAYVMGCGEDVTIYPDPTNDQVEQVYFRAGYGTLYENFAHVDSLTMAYWHQYGRQRGEPKPSMSIKRT